MLTIFAVILVAGLFSACDAAPVVVVATPVPPDMNYHTYRHPSSVFSLRLPPDWSVRDVSKGDAVRVEFSPPSNTGLPMTVYVINTGSVIDASTLLDSIDKYQSAVNGNPALYTEVSRNAQGDGSWRITGVRKTPIGSRQLNTFIQADKAFLSVIEMDITDASPELLQTMKTVLNTYRVSPDASITASTISGEPSGVNTSSGVLDFGGLFTWTNSQGAFVINGQVTNQSGGPLEAVRVTALLYDSQNNVIGEQANVLPLEVLSTNGISPFTVQFKTGKPAQAVRYELQGTGRYAEYALKTHLGDDKFVKGNDKATFNAGGYLTVGGDVVNGTQQPAHFVKATVTVYDEQQHVIATDSVFLSKPDLLPGEAAKYEVTFAEMGGSAYRYSITIEGKTDS
jgi:hypothetical protein